MNKKAVILLSGGLDSTPCLAIAREQGFDIFALTINYGQRHTLEIESAKSVVKNFDVVKHSVVDIDLRQFGGSALTADIDVPKDQSESAMNNIPVTYVPGRNIIFLSFAAGYAEYLDLEDIYLGVNSVDYSGYPDCRPEFIKSFNKTANLATKFSVSGNKFLIHTPLINLSKPEIIQIGHKLDLDYSNTVSCYQANKDGFACRKCDACHYRMQGFLDAGLEDVTKYA